MAQAETASATSQAPRKAYYLFDDSQSAALETFRFALRGISDLAADNCEADREGEAMVKRTHIKALFDVLESHLGTIIGPEAVGHAYLDPRIVVSAVGEGL